MNLFLVSINLIKIIITLKVIAEKCWRVCVIKFDGGNLLILVFALRVMRTFFKVYFLLSLSLSSSFVDGSLL